MLKNFITLGLTLFWVQNVFSAGQCLSGKEGNDHLIQQLELAKQNSYISKAIAAKYNLNPVLEGQALSSCKDCFKTNFPLSKHNQRNIEALQVISQAQQPETLLFKEQCLEASAQMDTSTSELKCPQNTTSSRYDFCFSADIYKYENAVITDFYKCFKKETNFPISPEGLFEMYSLESGFKPHFAYVGGVGLGQLTGIFVDDVHQNNRGGEIMSKISQSTNPECDIAKKMAQNDLTKKPKLSNRCNFVQFGEGLERNILYTMVGLANGWEKDIKSAFGNYLENNSGNPALTRASELALFNSYGPGGRAAARATVRRLKKLSPSQFVARIQQPLRTSEGRSINQYITKIVKRRDQVKNNLTGALRTDFEREGARQCLN